MAFSKFSMSDKLTRPQMLPEIKVLSSKNAIEVIYVGCFSRKCFSMFKIKSTNTIAPSINPIAKHWKSSSKDWKTAQLI